MLGLYIAEKIMRIVVLGLLVFILLVALIILTYFFFIEGK